VSDRGGPGWGGPVVAVVRAVGLRPRLWPAALGALGRLAPRGWWHRRPFLPMPDPGYWHFRMETAFGQEPSGRPSADDVVDYLEWCRRTRPSRR